MPIHPSELAAQRDERDFSRLCAAIDKHILEYEKAGPIRFKLHPDTDRRLIQRVCAAYMDKGWAVSQTTNDLRVDWEKSLRYPKKGVAVDTNGREVPFPDHFLEFTTREQALGVPMSAEEILDNATNKLTRIEWMIRRASLLPTQYEVCINGQIVSDVNDPDSSIDISIRQVGATSHKAALKAVEKLRQLVAFIPDITVFDPPTPSDSPYKAKAA